MTEPNYSEDIDKAIAEHALWKQRLRTAIATGQREFNVAQVRLDNRCEFGKWFYGLPVTLRATEQGKRIQAFHTKFHAEVARILDLLPQGRKEEALKAIARGSQYASISAQLVIALTQWKQTIGKA